MSKQWGNEDRNRYYGIRRGDTVICLGLQGEQVAKGKVVEYSSFDNNRVYIETEKGERISWVAEWCRIITKVEEDKCESK